MDRQIVYPGQILPETSLLQMAKDAMIGSAKLAAAVLGTSTIANGFAVTPTGPASLQIVVAPGEIYSLANIDSLAFSTLPADTTHSILKQGIMLDGVVLSCPAPTTSGQSINYLIQATYQDQDSTPVLLPYYNSANPALPYSGMGNNGLTQNTSRKGVAIVQVKAGASAATGSQVTPAPDSGYVGLFVATVAYGQTTITSGNITQYAGAPLLPSGVLQSIQGGNTTYALDTGTVNACAATFLPAITALVDGLTLRFKAANSNTGAATFSPNGMSAAPIVGSAHAALQGGEIVATGDVWIQWNSTLAAWILVEGSGGALQVSPGTKSRHAASLSQIQSGYGLFGFDTGTVNIYNVAYSPAIAGFSEGMLLTFKAASTNTGASVFTIDGVTSYPILGSGHQPLQGGEISAFGEVSLRWNGSLGTSGSWVLVESSGGGLQVASGTKSQHAISAGQAQAQSVTAFTTGGVSTALTLTPVPAIAAYAANQRFRVKFSQASTGTDTINVSGLGVKSIKQYDSTGAKVAAVFAVNQLADVEYDGTDMVVLDPLPSGAVQATESVAGVAKVATQALTNAGVDDATIVTPKKLFAAQQTALNLKMNLTGDGAVPRLGAVSVNDNGLTPNQQGAYLLWNELGNGVTSLVNNRGDGVGGFVFRTVNKEFTVETGRVTIDGSGSLSSTGSIKSASAIYGANGAVMVATDGNLGGSVWGGWLNDYITNYVNAKVPLICAALFTGTNVSLAANGYQKLPSGLIIQWGNVTIGADTIATITWPISFPTAALQGFVSQGASMYTGTDAGCSIYNLTTTTAAVVNGLNAPTTLRYFSIGY